MQAVAAQGGRGRLLALAQPMSWNPHWRRPPRTRAAAQVKAAAIGKAVHGLKHAGIAYAQPLPGKLVVEPPPRCKGGGKPVTYWPARKRLRIGPRGQTRTEQDLHAFEQALAAQGHRVPGYVPQLRPRLPDWRERAEEARPQWEQRAAELAELDAAIAQSLARLRRWMDQAFAAPAAPADDG
ncbi:MAG: hypothetical protein ACJ8H8_07665 [Geminicoccaceae bacterium]